MNTELIISKEWLKPKNPCAEGYHWYLEKFPQGASFGVIYRALRSDARYADADWLVDAAITGVTTKERVTLLTEAAGANADAIAADVQAVAGSGDVTTTAGNRANAATTGESANAATTGESANAATTGYRANAATTGYRANAATTGNYANAATTGYRANAATTGESAVAASLGYGAKAMAGIGGAIVLAHRDNDAKLLGIKASMVGENGIKPNVWYSLNEAGEFVEVE